MLCSCCADTVLTYGATPCSVVLGEYSWCAIRYSLTRAWLAADTGCGDTTIGAGAEIGAAAIWGEADIGSAAIGACGWRGFSVKTNVRTTVTAAREAAAESASVAGFRQIMRGASNVGSCSMRA